MNTSTQRGTAAPAQSMPGHRALWGTFWAALTTAASFGLGAWALARASGITQLTDTDYSTEFIDGDVLWLVNLLLVGVYLATTQRVVAGLMASVGLVAGQVWAMAICVNRYHESGWSDGLEVLGFLLPIFFGGCALVVVLATWLVRRRRERR